MVRQGLEQSELFHIPVKVSKRAKANRFMQPKRKVCQLDGKAELSGWEKKHDT